MPVSNAGDAFKTGFNGQGFARFNLSGLPIQPRVDFTFSRFDIDDVKLQTPSASGTGQIFAGIANDKPVLFLHPKDFYGTLIELEQA